MCGAGYKSWAMCWTPWTGLHWCGRNGSFTPHKYVTQASRCDLPKVLLQMAMVSLSRMGARHTRFHEVAGGAAPLWQSGACLRAGKCLANTCTWRAAACVELSARTTI